MKLQYTFWPSEYGAIPFPIVDLTLKNLASQKEFVNYKVLVDSGATSCVFHAGIGELIGLNIKLGEERPLRGVIAKAGKQYIHEIIMRIENQWDVKAKVGFSYDLRFPFGLLGQQEFFDLFRICFDLSKKTFEITPKLWAFQG